MEGGVLRPAVSKAQQAHTVGEVIENYLEDCRRRGLRPSTLVSYEGTFRHLRAALGEKPIDAVTVEMLATWSAGRKGKSKQPLTPRSAIKEIENVRGLFRFAMDREWASKNPAARLKAPKTPKHPATLPFTPTEVRKILTAVETFGPKHQRAKVVPRIRALVLLLLHTGLRISDAANLTRSRIDWKQRYLTLRQEKTGEPVRIPLSPKLIEVLDVLPERLFSQGPGRDSTLKGSLHRSLDRLGEIAGVHVHPHRFRDTFAVQLLSEGADIRTVQLLLGHDSVKTTEKHYAHFVKEHQAILDAAVAKLDFTSGTQPIALPAAG
jgi:site-specific recombinase XerD